MATQGTEAQREHRYCTLWECENNGIAKHLNKKWRQALMMHKSPTHQTSRTQTFDHHAYKCYSLCCGFLCKWGHREDRLHQSKQLETSLECAGRNYRSSRDASCLSSNWCGFLDVLKSFCSAGRPDHGVPCAVCHLDVRAGERQDKFRKIFHILLH